MKITKDTVVRLKFSLYTEDGEFIDGTNEEGYEVIVADDSLPQGIKKSLNGKSIGSRYKVQLGPTEGYGDYDDALVDTIPASQFEDIEHIEEGGEFVTEIDGNPVMLRVTEIDGDKVTVDANHSLAGLTILWNIEILDIREATAKELEFGLADDYEQDDCDHDHAPGEVCNHTD